MYQSTKEINKAATLLNNYFDKIYVVTLESALERHAFLKDSLKSLSFEFVYGQDKKNLTSSEISKLYDDEKAKKNKLQSTSLKLGDIAISLSHRNAYQKMIDDKVGKALIFEDDAFFIEENVNALPSILEELPNDWDCIYFGYIKNETPSKLDLLKMRWYLLSRTLGFYKLSKLQIKNRFPKHFSQHLKIAGRHDCIHALGITQKAAKILVENQTPIQYGPDPLVATLSGKELLRSYITVPKIFDQGSWEAAKFRVETMNLPSPI